MVALRKDLVNRYEDGKPTGKIHSKGERWRVLPGITSDPVLWFLPPDGRECTWDDDLVSVNAWFEIVSE